MAPIKKVVADKQFKDSLKRSRAGRILQAHLAGMKLRDDGVPHDSAMQEAVNYERVFIKTMAACMERNEPFPCGLPLPLPRFIAILNLSGERLLVHSNTDTLVRLLCTRSSQLCPSELVTHVDCFCAHPTLENGNQALTKFVVLSLSLPWQAGTGSLFWKLSACSFRNDLPPSMRCLDDRALTLSSHSPDTFVGKSVLDRSDFAIPLSSARDMALITPDQMKKFTDAYTTTCLDPLPQDEDDASLGAEGGNAHSRAREEMLRDLVTKLRKKCSDAEERADKLKVDYDDAILVSVDCIKTTEDGRREELDRHQKSIQALRRERDEFEERTNALTEQCNLLHSEAAREKKASTKLQERFDQQKRQSESKDALANSVSAKAAMQIKALEEKLVTAQRSLASAKQEASRERERALERLQTNHDAEVGRMCTKLAGKTRIIDQLSENNESRNSDLASLKTREAEQEEELTRWRQASADAIEAVSAANVVADASRAEARDARAAAHAAMAELSEAKEQLARLQIARRGVGVGTSTATASTETHRCATTQTHREEAPPEPAAPEPAAPVDAATESAPLHEANAPTATTGASKGAETSDGGLSGEMCRQATDALQRLVNHMCIVEHRAPPVHMLFQYPPAGFDPRLMQAAYMMPPMASPQQPPPMAPQRQPPSMVPLRHANGQPRFGKAHRPPQCPPQCPPQGPHQGPHQRQV